MGFRGDQSSETVWLQGNTLHFLGAEWPLGDHGLGLTLQSDDGLIDGVESGAAGSIHYSQALLQEHRDTFISLLPAPFYFLRFNGICAESLLFGSLQFGVCAECDFFGSDYKTCCQNDAEGEVIYSFTPFL